MNMPHHRLPHEIFAGLASGGGGYEAVRELAAAEFSKHVILLRGVLIAAHGGTEYQLARVGYDLLAAAWRKNRAATEKVIRHPSVGAWARRTIEACRSGLVTPGAEPGGLRAVGAAAAIHSGLAAEIEVAVTDGLVMLPSLGAAMVPGRAAIVRCDDGHTAVGAVSVPRYPYQNAPGWLGLHRVRAGLLDLLIDDLDPFRMPDAPNLSRRMPVEPWDAALQQAWSVLEKGHSVVAAEIATAVSVIVPRSQPQTGATSTTSSECFGAIAMSIPPDRISCAETLVHETQHLKLSALLDIVTLTLPDDGRLYYAPWRDDPRPFGGLLQGTYAYLGVTGFWLRQHQLADGPRRADAKYARRRIAVARAVDTLRSSGRLTSAGLEFVNGIARTLDLWQDEKVTAPIEAEARRAADSHLDRWGAANGTNPRLHDPADQIGGGSKSKSSRRPSTATNASGWPSPIVAS